MNICILTSLADLNAGGIANHALSIARSLSRLGHRFTLVTRGGWHGIAEEENDGIRILRVRFLPLHPFHVSFHGFFVRRLLKALQDDFDLCHVHSPLVPVPGDELPIMTTVHTPMRSEARHMSGPPPYRIAARLQIKVVSKLEESLFRRSKRIGVVANSVTAELAEYNVFPSKVDWVGTGVDYQTFVPSAHTGPGTEPYVLYSGRLLERKGLRELLQAASFVCKEFPRVQFRILGNGPMRRYLEREVERLRLQGRFLLLGHIPFRTHQRELVELYQGAAVFVQPSYYEGLPATLLEAMACGRPVVATAVSGHLDAVQPNVNGLLVPPRNAQAIADALLTLLQDGATRHTLGRAARSTIEERFTWDAVAERTFRCYQKALEG